MDCHRRDYCSASMETDGRGSIFWFSHSQCLRQGEKDYPRRCSINVLLDYDRIHVHSAKKITGKKKDKKKRKECIYDKNVLLLQLHVEREAIRTSQYVTCG
ncbi:hypothetical protein ANCCAN_08891 [Ancylostoma caninum]|uniref:Uncharacterized protein n=1 Tax=Ancylostoma caninum TaxID=29170 RepID=A0A368GL21_ANCCA|nr:hypothetical protein ANCCAN_08891 [Ancylostoma caninum]